jgi:tetratricopeptide (TPR) repeat protein
VYTLETFKMIKSITFFSLIICSTLLAQSPSGYWDNQRMTNKEISLAAGNKIIIKSEDLPAGTTEFVYRITLLDENQKMVNDLASVLKAIPDPYYIGKGTGGAISLVSAISGSDKCTYALFVNEGLSADFIKTDKLEKACIFQKNPISKDAKLVSMKSTCLDEDTKNIWFAFKSENWLMSQKIVLEIVPWIDNVASRGWTKKNKEIALKIINTNSITQNIANQYKNSAGLKMVELVSKELRFQDFMQLSAIEQQLVIEKYEDTALSDIGLPYVYNEIQCAKAQKMAKTGKFDEAINYINDRVIARSKARAIDYNTLAELYMESNQFEKALKILQTAEKLDSSELKVQLNLAHTYMFMDEVSKSKEIHKRYKSQNVSAKQTWMNKAINDLDRFKKMDLPQKNIDKIWRLYN